jgi:hypothetical protein
MLMIWMVEPAVLSGRASRRLYWVWAGKIARPRRPWLGAHGEAGAGIDRLAAGATCGRPTAVV